MPIVAFEVAGSALAFSGDARIVVDDHGHYARLSIPGSPLGFKVDVMPVVFESDNEPSTWDADTLTWLVSALQFGQDRTEALRFGAWRGSPEAAMPALVNMPDGGKVLACTYYQAMHLLNHVFKPGVDSDNFELLQKFQAERERAAELVAGFAEQLQRVRQLHKRARAAAEHPHSAEVRSDLRDLFHRINGSRHDTLRRLPRIDGHIRQLELLLAGIDDTI